jgi:uncharacterized protein (DUF433 family)
MGNIVLDRIVVKSDVCLGQPKIGGMRITVAFMLKLLSSQLSISEILEAYPELDIEDIKQVLNYAGSFRSDF